MPKTATSGLPFSSRALIALQAMVFIAYHGSAERPITGTQITARYRLSQRALEPILQPLARAGLLTSQPGAYGGYYVADPACVRLADIAACFSTPLRADHLAFTHFAAFLLPPLAEAQQALCNRLAETTLADLCAQAHEADVPRSLDVCLDYMI